MPRIRITGHTNLSHDTAPLVAEALRGALQDYNESELVGITCLAQGPDQIFAQVVLERGGSVEVILPAADYRECKVKSDNLTEFDDLIGRARVVRTLPFEKSTREAYMAASEEVLGSADTLIAVWDCNPSGGHGGTADVVEAARKRGLPVTVIWPDGAHRDSRAQ